MKPYIYDRSMNLVGTLKRAHRIGYERVFNDLHTATFSLPVLDDDVAVCENTHYIIDIFDGDRSVGKFRITDEPEEEITAVGAVFQYSCDHVISFLADCRIDGYLEIGGEDVTTRDVIEELLQYQQKEWGFVRWVLGRCDFDYEFQHSFENTDVLNAIFSIPKCFEDDYHWTYDTSVYPWVLNLVKRDTTVNCLVKYQRNMTWIKRSKDRSNLCTRLYCLGSGEGVNQTNIRRLTPDGENYIESSTKSKHGVIAKHLIDRSINDDEMLFAKGKALLKEIDEPLYSYVVGGIDLYQQTGMPYYLMDEGKTVRVDDADAKIDFQKPILSVKKDDVELDPLGMEITIANKTDDVASSIENLSARAAITAQYSQGATNLFPMQVNDNADKDHPARLKFWIPETCAKINTVLLSWELDSFRAYETGAKSGGGTTSSTEAGGYKSTTTAGGGAYKKTIPEKIVTNAGTGGPLDYDGATSNRTSKNTTGTTTGSVGDHSHTVEDHRHSISLSDSISWGHTHGFSSSYENTYGVNNYKELSVSFSSNTGYKGTGTYLSGSHTHTVPAHTHEFIHYHAIVSSITIPAIEIEIENHTHSVNLPDHTHQIKLEDHTHDIVYGIYEGGIADSITIKVDGNAVPASKLIDSSGNKVAELDVVPYMSTDNEGRIQRGTWHVIELKPDSLTRIEAFLFVQTFVRSYSGGDY